MARQWTLVTFPVVAMFEQEMTKCKGRAEHGGILIGSYRDPHMEIEGYSRSGPKDVRRPFSFIKQDPSHQRVATRAWQTSGGKDTYVGEWHTHPFGNPEPSSIDRQTWRELVQKNRRPMVFVIVAPVGWQLFWCDKKWTGVSIRSTTILENGKTGIVFRPRRGWALRGRG